MFKKILKVTPSAFYCVRMVKVHQLLTFCVFICLNHVIFKLSHGVQSYAIHPSFCNDEPSIQLSISFYRKWFRHVNYNTHAHVLLQSKQTVYPQRFIKFYMLILKTNLCIHYSYKIGYLSQKNIVLILEETNIVVLRCL